MGRKKKSVENTTITLRSINAAEILQRYYADGSTEPEIEGTVLDLEEGDIEIVDLLHEKNRKSKRYIMFLDPHKSQIKLWGNMIDFAQSGALPRYTTKPCWWCRSKFKSHPIGCPMKYHSEKQKDSIEYKRIIKYLKEANLDVESGTDFFETEGLFCTFPCVKAYILDQLARTKSPKYKKSLTLLTLLYYKLMGEIAIIPTAGTWKTLLEWCGHLSPQEFRASTGLLEYVETINIRRPYMYSSSTYIQEKRLKV